MGTITTKKPLNIIGVGEITTGAKLSFKANFLERNQGLMAHVLVYKNQENYNNGVSIEASIEEIPQKDNHFIQMSEFTQEELLVLSNATAIIQSKVLAKLQDMAEDQNLLEII